MRGFQFWQTKGSFEKLPLVCQSGIQVLIPQTLLPMLLQKLLYPGLFIRTQWTEPSLVIDENNPC